MEEFLNNKDNAGKLIPQCMLEPPKKQRRHPIHKKKSSDGMWIFRALIGSNCSLLPSLYVLDECKIKEEDSETEDIKDIADVDDMESKIWFKDQKHSNNT